MKVASSSRRHLMASPRSFEVLVAVPRSSRRPSRRCRYVDGGIFPLRVVEVGDEVYTARYPPRRDPFRMLKRLNASATIRVPELASAVVVDWAELGRIPPCTGRIPDVAETATPLRAELQLPRYRSALGKYRWPCRRYRAAKIDWVDIGARKVGISSRLATATRESRDGVSLFAVDSDHERSRVGSIPAIFAPSRGERVLHLRVAMSFGRHGCPVRLQRIRRRLAVALPRANIGVARTVPWFEGLAWCSTGTSLLPYARGDSDPSLLTVTFCTAPTSVPPSIPSRGRADSGRW